ncbi:PorP/SprF family type IX secretion system membrane protein [Pedobacter sp. MW01-1-1]|uniref:PorP/SprF family type IX secretion system membrane protein n=1 Tax=Pedobacter sp. MW01-1-1 TaxID=3383027 RepID=UPI003FEEFB56
MEKIKFYIVGFFLSITASFAYGQLNPMGAIYFQNQFLNNPAMAGLENGLILNAGYKVQWSGIKGGPKNQYLTADYGLQNNKVGLGFTMLKESAGAINRTKFAFTYSYHLPLMGDSDFLDFGISMGLMDESFDYALANADLSDDVIASFNDRKTYIDGDFGATYRNKGLSIQGSVPNLKRIFNRDAKRNVVDQSIYYAAASYKFDFDNTNFTSVEPKIAYRGVENYDGIIDVGANLKFIQNKLMFSAIYHSTNSVTAGGGFNKDLFSIIFQYTTNTGQMQDYTNGDFEIGLKYHFKNKK